MMPTGDFYPLRENRSGIALWNNRDTYICAFNTYAVADGCYSNPPYVGWTGSSWGGIRGYRLAEGTSRGLGEALEDFDEWECKHCGTMNPADTIQCGTPFIGCRASR